MKALMTDLSPNPLDSPRSAARSSAPLRAMALIAAIAVVILPAAAPAQVAEAWLHHTRISSDPRPFSSRLEAMGSLSLAVEEDETKINAYDYSGNPARLFADTDSSSIQQYARYDEAKSQYFGKSQSAQQDGYGARVAVRQGNQWALEIEALYRKFESSQHDLFPAPDNGRFIREFDLPYPGDILGPSGDRAIGASIEAPMMLAAYSRPLFMKGLSVGLRLGYSYQSESRRVRTEYDLGHDLNSGQMEGGAIYDMDWGRMRASVGANVGWSSDKVTGTSEGPLNTDKYYWSRPLFWWSGQSEVRYGDWLRGIVDYRYHSYDGEIVAQVNWAPQFYLNPLPSEYQEYNVFKQKWSALLSGLRRNEFGTRWLGDVKGTPLHVGAEWRYRQEHEWFRPNIYVMTIGRELDVQRTGYTVGGALSADLPNRRGLVAVETHYGRDHRLDYTYALPEIATEQLTYNFGAEYRAVSWLPLRAGLVSLRADPDRGDAEPPVRGTRLTAGLGYEWAWLGMHIDVAYAHEHWGSPPEGGASEELRTGDNVSMVARFGF